MIGPAVAGGSSPEFSVKLWVGIWMDDVRLRKVAISQARHTLPCLVTATVLTGEKGASVSRDELLRQKNDPGSESLVYRILIRCFPRESTLASV